MAKNNDKDLMESGAKVKLGTSDKVIRGFGYAFVSFYAVCCIIPFLIIVSSSFRLLSFGSSLGLLSFGSSLRFLSCQFLASTFLLSIPHFSFSLSRRIKGQCSKSAFPVGFCSITVFSNSFIFISPTLANKSSVILNIQ